ncbi:loganic acid O-methyltransferase-like [Eucalyptus grandis]|uniref:loganic acid O-methyltransferase-like n=1 Tax=Eucalyptus grandis TaxID=71139 RepID=UPI00192ED0CD|nr:loganic acid O-methyltransferase-like [Eucalyptus grandis]
MTSVESFPMNDGDGVYSYLHNSCMQRRGIDVAVKMIVEAITEKLDVELLLSSSSIFRIVDSGCSVGPNTCFVVERVTESIKLKYQCQGLDLKNLEFQAFLNDQVTNDFNMLFKSLPMEKTYHVSVVPGSFHGRLSPKASLQFIHSSYALQWLLRVPPQVTERKIFHLEQGEDSHSRHATRHRGGLPRAICE